jgi:hypothetical protein
MTLLVAARILAALAAIWAVETAVLLLSWRGLQRSKGTLPVDPAS